MEDCRRWESRCKSRVLILTPATPAELQAGPQHLLCSGGDTRLFRLGTAVDKSLQEMLAGWYKIIYHCVVLGL